MSATPADAVASPTRATRRAHSIREWWQPVLVFATWIAMTIGAWSYVGTYASKIPIQDDLDLVPLIDPDVRWTVEELWSLHNEHRLPLPIMIEAGLIGATHDFRAPMFLEVVLLSGIALAAMLVVRKLRGRTLWYDALFPLLWLHTGNHENLLMAYQISIVLPIVIVCGLLLFMVTRPMRGFRPWEADVAGLCLVTMPLCGGQGMALLPLLFLMCACFGVVSWRSGDPVLRKGAIRIAFFLAVAAALAAYYVVDFRFPDGSTQTHDPFVTLGGATRVGSLMLGIAGWAWWPWSGVVVTLLVIPTSVLLARAWIRRPEDRMRLGALILMFGAGSLLLLSIGYGRAASGVEAGFAVRYIPMADPLVLACVLAWTIYGPRAWRWIVPGALALVLLFADVFVNAPWGVRGGNERRALAQEIEADVNNGMSPGTFALKYAGRVHPYASRLSILVREMARLRVPPFEDVPEITRQLYSWTMMNLPPVRTESARPPVQRMLGSDWPVLFVPVGCTLHFDVPADLHHVEGGWGVPDQEVERGRIKGMRLVVSSAVADGEPRHVLYDRTIDPVHVQSDRGGLPMDATIPPTEHHVVFEFLAPEGIEAGNDWAFVGNLNFL